MLDVQLVAAEGEGGKRTAADRDEDPPAVVRMEMVPALLLDMAPRTDTRCHHRTDHRRDNRIRRHHKALVGMDGTDGRRCRTIVGLEVGLRDRHEVGRTAEALEAGMDSLATPRRTDGEGIVAVVVVAAMVVQAPLMGLMVVTAAVHTALVVRSMELQEVEDVVVGSTIIYFCIFSLMFMDHDA